MSDDGVPPSQQCTLPSCTNQAVDPLRNGALCQEHLDGLDEDGADVGDQDHEAAEAALENDVVDDVQEDGEREPPAGDKPDIDLETTDERDHENPIDVSDLTDAGRAEMLCEYLEAFVDEFGKVPRLMPLEKDGKAPVAGVTYAAGRAELVDGREAIRQIREEGARGFALYAGRWDCNTEDLVLVDVDDRETFPYEAFPDTLEVLSGSGRGEHFTFRNAGDVENAKGKDGVDGEIRAKNWYCVTPGSVHPTGGVYHLQEERDVATLKHDDVPEELQPGTSSMDRDEIVELDPPEDLESADFTNDLGTSLEELRERDEKLDALLERLQPPGYAYPSTSEADFATVAKLWFWRFSEQQIANIMRKYRRRGKIVDRDGYLATTISKAARGERFDPDGDDRKRTAEQVSVLPEDEDLFTPTTGWDWRHAGQRESEEDLVAQARNRTTTAIADRIATGDRVLIEALPTLGKSYGAVKAAAETDEPVTIVTTRGNKEQYAQFEEWCEEFDLRYKRLPAFTRDCETARGDHGDGWQQTVMDWYRRGATGEEIHALAEQYHGQRLPCQHEGDCELAHAWNFDPDEYDVLIGHYTHAYKPKVTKSRTVLVDEFPEGAYEQLLDHGIEGAISYFLQEHDALPFEDYADLIENRHDDQRRADALAFLQDYGLDSDATAVLANPAGHAAAPAAVFTILAGTSEDLDNGWERAQFPDGNRIALFDRETGEVSILNPPDLKYSSAVIGLDGTPTKRLWQLVLGERRLNHKQVLTDEERCEYVQEGLNLNLVRTTDKVKSYSPKESEIEQRVNLEEDATLLEGIAEKHDQHPALITTARAESYYEDEGVFDLVDGHKHYGDILGSNEFDEQRLGAVIGSRNFGPRYVSKWSAYHGETVKPTYPGPENDFAPTDYGSIGNQIRAHMREHETLQAAMRFGRDANGAVVYVHTDTLPEWVPLAGEGRVITTWSEGMRQVVEAARDCESWRTTEIAEHFAVEVGQRRVFDILEDLRDRGYVKREHEGRGYTWHDDGLLEMGESGEVELAPVDVDELTDDEVAELARTDYNTWQFRNSDGEYHTPQPATGSSVNDTAEVSKTLRDDGGGPPD